MHGPDKYFYDELVSAMASGGGRPQHIYGGGRRLGRNQSIHRTADPPAAETGFGSTRPSPRRRRRRHPRGAGRAGGDRHFASRLGGRRTGCDQVAVLADEGAADLKPAVVPLDMAALLERQRLAASESGVD